MVYHNKLCHIITYNIYAEGQNHLQHELQTKSADPRWLREAPQKHQASSPSHFATLGTGLMGTYLNGYLDLQENMHFGAEWLKTILELLARKIIGTRWSKYPFSRRRHTGAALCPDRISSARAQRGGPFARLRLQEFLGPGLGRYRSRKTRLDIGSKQTHLYCDATLIGSP